MTWLTLLLCIELLDGTLECSPRTAPVPLASRSECLRLAASMVRSQAYAPDGYRWLLPRLPILICSPQRPSWPPIPAEIPSWQHADAR